MTFSHPKADILVSAKERDAGSALRRVTHLCIAAHQDDIEIMAHSGICDCLETPNRAFGGVVVTDGAGSPRTGPYASHTEEQMRAVRREEQRKAATLGGYAIQIQLAHPSGDIKRADHPGIASDLDTILSGCLPQIVYLHNPADKHDTHVAVLARCVEALRRLQPDRRPPRVLGCEVWRDLDWLADSDKVALDSGRRPELARELLAVFASQIAGGKRYDLAALGRRSANATFSQSHAADARAGITWAVDLTPVVRDGGPGLEAFTNRLVSAFGLDVSARLKAFAPKE